MDLSSWSDFTFPLMMSARVAACATILCVLIGTPVAYLLARHKWASMTVVEITLLMPLVLPPTVVGYAIILVCGRNGLLGGWLEHIGLPILFTWYGAVLAATCVSLPLMVLPAKAAFQGCDKELEEAAAIQGLGGFAIFWHITLPLTSRNLAAGALLCFARSLGEFGATLMVAGNLPHRTQTLPMALYSVTQTGEWADAVPPVAILVVAGVLIVIGYRMLMAKHEDLFG